MGHYLNHYSKERYYVVATDFANYAVAEVLVSDSTTSSKSRFSEKIFKSYPESLAKIIIKDNGKPEGVYFREDLSSVHTNGAGLNLIDAYGTQVLFSTDSSMFDALVVFNNIYSKSD
ncbi:hypothetical protein [Sphingobacterium sp. SYP-B4668]|uniref:hypothetical protein n=1 Tax=Sphingobacterium sp. SYP-B4668 TaxID=2996035 RepID=UPI0022DE67EE|nr:hypothetical protein [Sphingobacterium sp. SYP-B4668]